MTQEDTTGVYVMSIAAQLAGLHPQTLRLYERRGLLEPERSPGGNRRYSERDLRTLRRIVELTEAGVNIEGIRRVLQLESRVAELEARVDALTPKRTSSVARRTRT